MDAILSSVKLRQLAESWLNEDQPAFDFGLLAVEPNDRIVEAKLFCKQSCLLAGRPFFDAVFDLLGCQVTWEAKDGDRIEVEENSKRVIAKVSGPCRQILSGERPALNCLSRCSGVSTSARRIVDIAENWSGKIACTRKTTPGFRLVEKYGVSVGGCDPHRYDLSSMIMLKDNHLDACGGDYSKAVAKVRKLAGFSLKIEVETRNENEALAGAKSGADIIMLDNFHPEDAKRVAKLIKKDYPHKIIEVSGGVNAGNVLSYCSPDVDVISMGCLTQGYPCIDFSLKF